MNANCFGGLYAAIGTSSLPEERNPETCDIRFIELDSQPGEALRDDLKLDGQAWSCVGD